MQLNTLYILTYIIPTRTIRKVLLSPLYGAGTERLSSLPTSAQAGSGTYTFPSLAARTPAPWVREGWFPGIPASHRPHVYWPLKVEEAASPYPCRSAKEIFK